MLAAGLFLFVLASPLPAQAKRRCTGEAPDPAWLAEAPVYRDCEVDRPARLQTAEVRIDFVPPPGAGRSSACFRAEFQFVVDTIGHAEPATVRPASSNDRSLEEAMRAILDQLRYQPAVLQGARVRQIVVYTRTVAPIVRVTPDDERTGLPDVRSTTICR